MATYLENSCSFGLRYVLWYKYLTVSLVFSHLGFWSGNLFLIAPFPDLCLLVPFYWYHFSTYGNWQLRYMQLCWYITSFFVIFSLILSDLINTHTTKVTIYLYNRLYGYRILSFSTLCLSVAKMQVIFYVNCLNFSVTFL